MFPQLQILSEKWWEENSHWCDCPFALPSTGSAVVGLIIYLRVLLLLPYFFFLLIFSSLNGKWLWFIACSFWSVEVKRFSRSKVTCWSLHWSLPYPLFSSFASCLHDVASCLPECDWEKKERKKMLFWLIWAISDFCFNRESWHYCFDVYCLAFFFFCQWETVVLSWHFFQLFTMPSPYGQLYIIALKKKKYVMMQVLELFPFNGNYRWNEERDLEDPFLSYCC